MRTRRTEGCCEAVSQWVANAFKQQLQEPLGAYALPPAEPAAIELGHGEGYEAMAVNAETQKHAALISHERLHAALEGKVRGLLTEQAAQVVMLCGATLDCLVTACNAWSVRCPPASSNWLVSKPVAGHGMQSFEFPCGWCERFVP